MAVHLKRYIGLCFLLLVVAGVLPTVVDGCRHSIQLPEGYGAEGDRLRSGRIPARATVEDFPEDSGEVVTPAAPSSDVIQPKAQGGAYGEPTEAGD